MQRFYQSGEVRNLLTPLTQQVEEGKISPYKAAKHLIEAFERHET